MWGDIQDESPATLPAPEVSIKGDVKTVTEYRLKERTNQKEKVIKVFKIKNVIQRKNNAMLERESWAKFGACANDGPGPVKDSTYTQDEQVFLYLTSRAETLDDEVKPDLKKLQKNTITCSICKGAHFTSKCPERDDSYDGRPNLNAGAMSKPGIYVPPSKRGGGGRMGDDRDRRPGEGTTVRVSNLPEETREGDLQALFKTCGHIIRLFMARDKFTQQFRGYAHIGFSRREEAVEAIRKLHGYGFGHLVMEVEWPRERD